MLAAQTCDDTRKSITRAIEMGDQPPPRDTHVAHSEFDTDDEDGHGGADVTHLLKPQKMADIPRTGWQQAKSKAVPLAPPAAMTDAKLTWEYWGLRLTRGNQFWAGVYNLFSVVFSFRLQAPQIVKTTDCFCPSACFSAFFFFASVFKSSP